MPAESSPSAIRLTILVGPLVGAVARRYDSGKPVEMLIGQSGGNLDRASMRHLIVHAADAAVLDDPETLDQLDDGLAVFLTVHMRFAQMKEEEVPPRTSIAGIGDDGIGDTQGTDAAFPRHDGTVAGEVEELARSGEPSNLRSHHMALDDSQRQSAGASHVHPRTQHGDGDGIMQRRRRVDNFKMTYFHVDIVSYRGRIFKPPMSQRWPRAAVASSRASACTRPR